jgi:hypothetical protein
MRGVAATKAPEAKQEHHNTAIRIMFEYSARKNIAKGKEE